MSTTSTKKPTGAGKASRSAKSTSKKTTVSGATASKAKPPKAAAMPKSTDASPPVSAVGSAPSVPVAQAKPAVVESLSPVVAGRQLRKKELYDLVTARAGMKKKDVKPVVDAMLAVLGEAVAQHRVMHLMPLGKVKIQRAKELQNGRAIILKLRQNDPLPSGSDDDS